MSIKSNYYKWPIGKLYRSVAKYEKLKYKTAYKKIKSVSKNHFRMWKIIAIIRTLRSEHFVQLNDRANIIDIFRWL